MNPKKKYDVTPQIRAQILGEMLSGGDDETIRCKCKNVQYGGAPVQKVNLQAFVVQGQPSRKAEEEGGGVKGL